MCWNSQFGGRNETMWLFLTNQFIAHLNEGWRRSKPRYIYVLEKQKVSKIISLVGGFSPNLYHFGSKHSWPWWVEIGGHSKV